MAKITAEDILRQTAAGKVDGMREMLLHHVPCDEVWRAVYERIGGAALDDFEILTMALLRAMRTPQRSLRRDGRRPC
jgi:hypothetical protein